LPSRGIYTDRGSTAISNILSKSIFILAFASTKARFSSIFILGDSATRDSEGLARSTSPGEGTGSVRVVLLRGHATSLHDILVGSGEITSSATPVSVITRNELLGSKFGQRVASNSPGSFDTFGGRESPARATSALVLHSNHLTLISPIKISRGDHTSETLGRLEDGVFLSLSVSSRSVVKVLRGKLLGAHIGELGDAVDRVVHISILSSHSLNSGNKSLKSKRLFVFSVYLVKLGFESIERFKVRAFLSNGHSKGRPSQDHHKEDQFIEHDKLG
jgi:hypothetical protein